MKETRRKFIQKSTLAGLSLAAFACNTESTTTPVKEDQPAAGKNIRHNPIGVSSYSFWQFNGPKEEASMSVCIEKAAAMGFDGIEFLLVQMISEEDSHLMKLKKQAFHAGLDLMGFSTHQGFVYPDPAERQSNIDKTIHTI